MQDPIIQAAVDQYHPVKLFALFSGGDDSITSTHRAMRHGAHEVVHVNTGIGVRQTREFVRETCKSLGWPLRELHPPALNYRAFVLKYGFPGPGGHMYAYSWLKERALRVLLKETKVKHSRQTVGFITGVRSTESARRMGYVKPVQKVGSTIWIAPMFQMSKIGIYQYKLAHKLPTNPVTEILGMSGECLCGAFAQPNEIMKIEKHFPEVAAQIHGLEAEAATAGVHAVWGTRPPKQRDLNQFEIPFMPLCSGCPTRK